MITVSGSEITPDSILHQYMAGSIQRKVLDKLFQSSITYKYTSQNQLKFELDLRAGIVNASVELNESELNFSTFRKSTCNTAYWERTREGGFLVKGGVKPSDAIRDIYINSQMYGTECATAIVIIYYKALVEIFPDEKFNYLFQGIYLMNWKYVDSDLGIRSYENIQDVLPGDCLYFKNPDVNPITPQWQGENVIDLGNGRYYGHGVGIRSAEGIIAILNRLRKSGATQSAYLSDSVTRPDFKHLADVFYI